MTSASRTVSEAIPVECIDGLSYVALKSQTESIRCEPKHEVRFRIDLDEVAETFVKIMVGVAIAVMFFGFRWAVGC